MLLLAGKWAPAQYKPTDNGSAIKFTIKNLGFRVGGSFTGLQGDIRFDPAHVTDAFFDISADAGTVNTDNSMRDDHLRGSSYFDIKTYPRIRFVSEKISASNKKGVWVLSGKLTIKGHTKDISFPFSATASPDGGYIFKATFTINRRDFEVGGFSTLSDDVDLDLQVFVK
jgi:polyisoprenoid-binding protein YceI